MNARHTLVEAMAKQEFLRWKVEGKIPAATTFDDLEVWQQAQYLNIAWRKHAHVRIGLLSLGEDFIREYLNELL